jgi:hypothetical protein
MRYTTIAAIACTLLAACDKKDNHDAQPAGNGTPLQIYGVPIPGIFTWVEDADTWGYLQADDAGGFVYRGTVPDTYSLNDLAADDNCRIEMIGRDLSNGPVAYGVNMPGTEAWWVPIDVSGDLQLKQVDLGLTLLDMPDFAGSWCWIRHDRGSVDGQPLYAMESLSYPGMYWSIQGTIVNWNTIKLIHHDSPSEAQAFIFR